MVNLSAYLPPQKSTYIDVYSLERVAFYKSSNSDIYGDVKYSELFKFPYDLKGFFDYDESVLFAKKVNKPILFTHSSTIATLSIQILFIHSNLKNNWQNNLKITGQMVLRMIH